MDNCPVCQAYTNEVIKIKFVELIGISDSFDQHVRVCDICGYIYSNSIPIDIMTAYYKGLESTHYMDHHNQQTVGEDKVKMTKRQFSFVSDKVNDILSVIDIGALTGFNLNTYKNAGYEVYGVEPSANNTMFARDVYGIDMFTGTFEEYHDRNKTRKFDLAILSHVLEHIVNPLEFIRKVSDINSKYIYIEVPAAIDYQLNNEPFGIFYYEHVNFFALSSLNALMNKAGYSCLRGGIELNVDETAPGEPALVTLWKKGVDKQYKAVTGVYHPAMLFQQYCKSSLERMTKISAIIDDIPSETKLAIWGAGSHTSRLLGMTSLSKKNIVKFFDADEQKQKHKLLGKPISGFSREDFDLHKVDKVLISTYSGEKSILTYLRKIGLGERAIALYN